MCSWYLSRKESTDDEILKEIKKCTKSVNNNLLEQTAYIRACAEKKNLNLQKFKEQVESEMKNKEDDEEKNSLSYNLRYDILTDDIDCLLIECCKCLGHYIEFPDILLYLWFSGIIKGTLQISPYSHDLANAVHYIPTLYEAWNHHSDSFQWFT